MYDVVVAGGSIAGLCCAREAALGGCSVLVIEDDAEVGTPEIHDLMWYTNPKYYQ